MKVVRKVLHERKMSQLQLAIAANISPFRLSRLFHHRAQLRAGDRRRIAHALGLSRDKLFPRRRK